MSDLPKTLKQHSLPCLSRRLPEMMTNDCSLVEQRFRYVVGRPVSVLHQRPICWGTCQFIYSDRTAIAASQKTPSRNSVAAGTYVLIIDNRGPSDEASPTRLT